MSKATQKSAQHLSIMYIQIKTTLRCNFIPIRMTIIRKIVNNGDVENGNAHTLLVGMLNDMVVFGKWVFSLLIS